MPGYFWTILMVLFAIFIVLWFMRGAFFMQMNKSKAVELDDMERLLKEEDAVMVDVRTKQEYDKGHIPGAVHVLADTAKQEFPRLYPDRKKPYILYCSSGMRSSIVIDHLKEEGYTNLHDLKRMKRYTGELETSKKR